MRKVVTEIQADYISKHYLVMSAKDIGAKLGLKKGTVRSHLRSKGISIPKELADLWRSAAATGRTTFTSDEDKVIRQLYLTTPVKTIGAKIGRSYTGVMNRIKNLGMVIPPEIVEQRKQSSRIQKGDTPPNKGKKQTEYMTAEAIARTAATRFKKGQLPHNTKADGVISIRKMKGGDPYQYIRVALGKWELLQRNVWANAKGTIPEGHIIVFKDGNFMNCDIENLEMITMAENMQRNTIQRFPPELKTAIRTVNKLNRTLNKLKN